MANAVQTVPAVNVQRPVMGLGLSAWQWMVFVVQPLLLLAAALWTQATQPESFRLLFTESLGQKLLLQAGLFLAGNAAILIAGSWVIKRFLEAQQTARLVLTLALHAVSFVLLFLPALWVVLLGPAAVAIQRALSI